MKAASCLGDCLIMCGVIWSVHRDLLSVLLKYLRRTGLLSQFTYSQAEELVYSATGLSELLRYPVCAAEEANVYEYSQDPQ